MIDKNRISNFDEKTLKKFFRINFRSCYQISTRTKSSSKNQESTFATATRPKFQEDPNNPAPKGKKLAPAANELTNLRIASVPLSESLPGLPGASYAEVPKNADPYETKISTLENGLRVATAPHFGEFCTIGVLIDAGSRYEAGFPNGVSHFLEKLAFNVSLWTLYLYTLYILYLYSLYSLYLYTLYTLLYVL